MISFSRTPTPKVHEVLFEISLQVIWRLDRLLVMKADVTWVPDDRVMIAKDSMCRELKTMKL